MSITDEAQEAVGGRSAAEVFATLRAELDGGKYAPQQFLPTERQLAANFGVAQNTVRRALKALEGERFITAVARHGYRVLSKVNDPQRGCPMAFVNWQAEPAETWSNIDGLLLSELKNVCDQRNWPLLAMSAGGLTARQIVERICAARSFGVVTSTLSKELLSAIRSMGLPTLMLDQWIEGSGIDSIMQDGHQGGLLAARHLVDQGCTRIAWFGWIDRNAHSMARFGGVAAGLIGEGRPLAQERIFATPESGGLQVARKMLASPKRPDGIVALWQGSTLEVKRAAEELGLKMGRDFQLVGWSMEENFSNHYAPHFGEGPIPPTICWSVRTMAATAAARLAQRRDDPKMPALQIKIPVRLRLPDKETA